VPEIQGAQRQPRFVVPAVQHEPEILEAYQAGVDECVVKPISPAIFLAKIMA
jgi:response regulator RpfG family c-di-GMP phosphodiesterase